MQTFIKHQSSTYWVTIRPNEVPVQGTSHSDGFASGWSGTQKDVQGTSRGELYYVRKGSKISLAALVGFNKENKCQYSHDIEALQYDYKALIRLSGLFDLELPKSITAQGKFGETSMEFIVQDELDCVSFGLQVQHGMSQKRLYFSDTKEVTLTPHLKFDKYGFDSVEWSETTKSSLENLFLELFSPKKIQEEEEVEEPDTDTAPDFSGLLAKFGKK